MTNIQSIYSALSNHGLSKKHLSRIMPEWWSAEVEATPGGAQRAKIYLAKALSLQIRPFSESPPRVEFDVPGERRFKLSSRTSETDVELAVAIARSASRIAINAIERDFVQPAPSASAIRDYILGTGAKWVGLTELLDVCWAYGIPVLHLASPLLAKKKMDGIAMSINGRPSIVLSNIRKSGFLLFHLAHEIGHIALGHLGENGAIVDDDFEEQAKNSKSADEVAADRFALELLTGNPESSLVLQQKMNAARLANLASAEGVRRKVDPTHLVMSCAHNDKKYYALFVGAANILGGDIDDQSVVTNKVFEQISSGLTADAEHLLRNLIA
jgi:Zn-dependent peptidase ImmA (M78 family)